MMEKWGAADNAYGMKYVALRALMSLAKSDAR